MNCVFLMLWFSLDLSLPACTLFNAHVLNRLDIRGLLTISRYMWCYPDVLLVLRLTIGFERALFPGLSTGYLTVFSRSMDLKEAAT